MDYFAANNYTPAYPPPLDYESFYVYAASYSSHSDAYKPGSEITRAKRFKEGEFEASGCQEERQEECGHLYNITKHAVTLHPEGADVSVTTNDDKVTLEEFLNPYVGRMIPSTSWLTEPSPLPLTTLLPEAFKAPPPAQESAIQMLLSPPPSSKVPAARTTPISGLRNVTSINPAALKSPIAISAINPNTPTNTTINTSYGPNFNTPISSTKSNTSLINQPITSSIANSPIQKPIGLPIAVPALMPIVVSPVSPITPSASAISPIALSTPVFQPDSSASTNITTNINTNTNTTITTTSATTTSTNTTDPNISQQTSTSTTDTQMTTTTASTAPKFNSIVDLINTPSKTNNSQTPNINSPISPPISLNINSPITPNINSPVGATVSELMNSPVNPNNNANSLRPISNINMPVKPAFDINSPITNKIGALLSSLPTSNPILPQTGAAINPMFAPALAANPMLQMAQNAQLMQMQMGQVSRMGFMGPMVGMEQMGLMGQVAQMGQLGALGYPTMPQLVGPNVYALNTMTGLAMRNGNSTLAASNRPAYAPSPEEVAWVRSVAGQIGIVIEDSDLLVESLLFKAVALFITHMTQETYNNCVQERDKDTNLQERGLKVILPLHVADTCYKVDLFDFLTDKGMYIGPPKSNEDNSGGQI